MTRGYKIKFHPFIFDTFLLHNFLIVTIEYTLLRIYSYPNHVPKLFNPLFNSIKLPMKLSRMKTIFKSLRHFNIIKQGNIMNLLISIHSISKINQKLLVRKIIYALFTTVYSIILAKIVKLQFASTQLINLVVIQSDRSIKNILFKNNQYKIISIQYLYKLKNLLFFSTLNQKQRMNSTIESDVLYVLYELYNKNLISFEQKGMIKDMLISKDFMLLSYIKECDNQFCLQNRILELLREQESPLKLTSISPFKRISLSQLSRQRFKSLVQNCNKNDTSKPFRSNSLETILNKQYFFSF